MSFFSSDKKLLLQQWVAGLGSDLEVVAVCRTLLESGYGTGLLPRVAAAVPAVLDDTTEGNTGVNSLVQLPFQIPPDMFRLIIEAVSWWKDLHQLRVTCRWARDRAIGLFRRDCEGMRSVHQQSAAKGGIHKLDLRGKRLSDVSGLLQCANL